jgi:hypothetical protein
LAFAVDCPLGFCGEVETEESYGGFWISVEFKSRWRFVENALIFQQVSVPVEYGLVPVV